MPRPTSTAADNALNADRARDRGARSLRKPGESNRWDKPYRFLTDEQVAEIRTLANSGEYSQRDIAAMYDIHQSTVSQIRTGRRRRNAR